jgi:YD repeat-containing protein
MQLEDAASNRTSITAPDGSVTAYGYDSLNRMNELANSWAGTFDFGRCSEPTDVADAAEWDHQTNYSSDSVSHFLSVLHQAGVDTVNDASYTYDAAGDCTAKGNYLNGATSNYTYDTLYELTHITQGGSATESYSNDAVGNRTVSVWHLGLSLKEKAVKRFLVLLFMVGLLSTAPTVSQTVSAVPPVVSVIQLIASPEKFDGKLISVAGYLRLENEAYLLYLHKEDYDNVILENALWVDPTGEMLTNREKLEFNFVTIVGTFHTGNYHKNNFSTGGLTDIKKCTFLSDPAHPREGKIRAMNKAQ